MKAKLKEYVTLDRKEHDVAYCENCQATLLLDGRIFMTACSLESLKLCCDDPEIYYAYQSLRKPSF